MEEISFMDDKKKVFVSPVAEIVEFGHDDVIFTSNPFNDGTDNAEDWGTI